MHITPHVRHEYGIDADAVTFLMALMNVTYMPRAITEARLYLERPFKLERSPERAGTAS